MSAQLIGEKNFGNERIYKNNRTDNLKAKQARANSLSKKLNRHISAEDVEVLYAIEDLKTELALMHQNLDYVTDETLLDSYIYELKSLHMKYQYYIRLCKEKGLIASVF